MSIYYEVYLKLKKDILNKKYLPNTPIPSERELMKTFSTSRVTIRNALLLLQNENLIYKVHGKGNFVSKELIKQELNNFYSFHDMIESLGKKPSSKVVRFELLKSDEFFSEIFNIPLNSAIYKIERLRLIDGKPIMLEKTYLPSNRFKEFVIEKLNKVAMYKVFKKEYGVFFEKAHEIFKPIMLKDKKDLKYLELTKRTLGMEIIRKTYEYGKVIEYTISHVKGDIFEYHVQLKL